MTESTPSTRRFIDEFSAWSGGAKPDEARFFSDALIAIDTSVLLAIYQMSANTRAALLKVLNETSERIWIPNQVAFEFSRNRKDSVEGLKKEFADTKKRMRKSEDDAIALLKAAVETFTKFRKSLHSPRSWTAIGSGCDPASIEKQIRAVLSVLYSETDTLQSEIGFSVSDLPEDFILAELDKIFSGRVGSPYPTSALEMHVNHAVNFRFPNKIPPGYADASEKDTPLKKAGDYLVWRQLIDHMREIAYNGHKCVLLVTEDHKYDWWELNRSKEILHPRPELICEMRDEAGVDLLMVSLQQFLTGARDYLEIKISPDAVSETEDGTSAVTEYAESLVAPALDSDPEAITILAANFDNPAFTVSPQVRIISDAIRNTPAFTAANRGLLETIRSSPGFQAANRGLLETIHNSPGFQAANRGLLETIHNSPGFKISMGLVEESGTDLADDDRVEGGNHEPGEPEESSRPDES